MTLGDIIFPGSGLLNITQTPRRQPPQRSIHHWKIGNNDHKSSNELLFFAIPFWVCFTLLSFILKRKLIASASLFFLRFQTQKIKAFPKPNLKGPVARSLPAPQPLTLTDHRWPSGAGAPFACYRRLPSAANPDPAPSSPKHHKRTCRFLISSQQKIHIIRKFKHWELAVSGFIFVLKHERKDRLRFFFLVSIDCMEYFQICRYPMSFLHMFYIARLLRCIKTLFHDFLEHINWPNSHPFIHSLSVLSPGIFFLVVGIKSPTLDLDSNAITFMVHILKWNISITARGDWGKNCKFTVFSFCSNGWYFYLKTQHISQLHFYSVFNLFIRVLWFFFSL